MHRCAGARSLLPASARGLGPQAAHLGVRGRELLLQTRHGVAEPSGLAAVAHAAAEPTLAALVGGARRRKLGDAAQLAAQLVHLLDERDVFLHHAPVVRAVQLHVLVELAFERLDGLLEVLPLPRVLRLQVCLHPRGGGVVARVARVEGLHRVLEGLGVLHVLDGLVQVRLERAQLPACVGELGALRDDLALQSIEAQAQVGERQLEGAVGAVVVLQLAVHLPNLLTHLENLHLSRLDLLLELLDLVVEHELELLELLVLFLEVVDALLLIRDGLVALLDLSLEPGNVLLETRDLRVELLLVGEERVDLLLLFVDLFLQRDELLVHDAVLALESQGLVALVCKAGLVLCAELVHLAVHILFDLMPRLLKSGFSLRLLVLDALEQHRVLLQLSVVLVCQVLQRPLVPLL
mmetsp:Transcript_11041/g.27865  ORF Transcript_11041/g.27865 Transcript_11041/m.27865 type:complete len:408 (-) Transcript_11041:2445-3668(-)